MGTLYAQLTEGERNHIYEFLQEQSSTSGFVKFNPLSHEASVLASPHAWQVWRASHHARLKSYSNSISDTPRLLIVNQTKKKLDKQSTEIPWQKGKK